MLYDTLHYMIALNLKLFFVLIAFGFIIGQTRQIAVRNISDKKLGNFLLDIFNLAGTPVHELGHLFYPGCKETWDSFLLASAHCLWGLSSFLYSVGCFRNGFVHFPYLSAQVLILL